MPVPVRVPVPLLVPVPVPVRVRACVCWCISAVVQKTLLANDVQETKLVIESIRQHYSDELETKRQQVHQYARTHVRARSLLRARALSLTFDARVRALSRSRARAGW